MTRHEFPGAGRYVVTAPLVLVRTTGRSVVTLYTDDPVPGDVEPTHRDHLLKLGMIAPQKETQHD